MLKNYLRQCRRSRLIGFFQLFAKIVYKKNEQEGRKYRRKTDLRQSLYNLLRERKKQIFKGIYTTVEKQTYEKKKKTSSQQICTIYGRREKSDSDFSIRKRICLVSSTFYFLVTLMSVTLHNTRNGSVGFYIKTLSTVFNINTSVEHMGHTFQVMKRQFLPLV